MFSTFLRAGCLSFALIFAGLAVSDLANAGGRQLVESDTIQIRVVGQADLDSQVRIGTDGTIAYPYIGRIRAAGLTEDQLADVIRSGLTRKDIVKKPIVIVTTVEAGVYFLYGYANKPGQYPLLRALTVQQAIAAGGGIAPLGSDWMIKIKRRGPEGYPMEFWARLDDPVEPNDTIIVNERIF